MKVIILCRLLFLWLFISYNAAVDHFYHPKLARAIQCSVERIVVRLGPSLEKFEEELSLLVQNEYCERQMVQPSGSAQVIKRYLRVLCCSVFFLSYCHASCVYSYNAAFSC